MQSSVVRRARGRSRLWCAQGVSNLFLHRLDKALRVQAFLAENDLGLTAENDQRREGAHAEQAVEVLRVNDRDGPALFLDERRNVLPVLVNVHGDKDRGRIVTKRLHDLLEQPPFEAA